MRHKKIKPSLDEFPHQVDGDEFRKGLLQEICQHFRGNGKWPVLRELYSKHGKQKVRDALSALTGNVGREESGSQRWKIYRLSLLGALLTEEGSNFQALLAQFFDFQRDIY